MLQHDTDTICAIATPTGRGGVGIIRVSGPKTGAIASGIIGGLPTPRLATFRKFRDHDSELLDEGLVLYFSAPNSFTGEDVLELHGHGGPHVLNVVLQRLLKLGARLARPGEFTERAFLNGKMDLLQAEAIADLIDASSQQSARSALRALQGVFSARINKTVEALTQIRVNVEAAIDFSDEEIEVLESTGVKSSLLKVLDEINAIFKEARQGALLKDGIHVVIAGAPNAGKSSLMNALCGNESAIVADIPGTTRDLLREQLSIDGLPVTITDTAGLRISDDPIEQEGVRRAGKVINEADRIFLIVDGKDSEIAKIDDGAAESKWFQPLMELGLEKDSGFLQRTTVLINKIDLLDNPEAAQLSTRFGDLSLKLFKVSAKQGLGLDLIREDLKQGSGFEALENNAFLARQRHLVALEESRSYIEKAVSGVSEHLQLELVAEDLRLAQQALGSITGEFSSDDLLGEIFSSFCIGK